MFRIKDEPAYAQNGFLGWPGNPRGIQIAKIISNHREVDEYRV